MNTSTWEHVCLWKNIVDFSHCRGMYLCRTLSYEGAEFEVIEAPLEDKMMVCDTDLLTNTILFTEAVIAPQKKQWWRLSGKMLTGWLASENNNCRA